MRKLVTRLAILAVLVLGVLSVVNGLYTRSQGYRNLLHYSGVDKLQNVPEGLAIVNFGSSHGLRGFDYSNSDIKGFNFGMSAQEFYYDYQLAKRYSKNLTKDCVVLIPISYQSFGTNLQEVRTSYDYRYYGILPYEAIMDHNILDYFKTRWCPVISSGSNVRWIVRDQAPSREERRMNEVPSSVRRKEADLLRRFLDQTESVHGFNQTYLESLLSYCHKRGWRPVLVTTPFMRQYNTSFPEDFFDAFYARVDMVRKKFGVPYLDFSHDESFQDNIDLFIDSNHLSMRGRAQFTRVVIEKLEGMGFLTSGSTQ